MSVWTSERLDDLSTRLQASPHIARLSGGTMGTVATYLPGRRISGLRVDEDDRVEVHVVMRWGSTVDDVEAGVVRALDDATLLGSLYIDDISAPGEGTPPEAMARPQATRLPSPQLPPAG